VIKLISARLNFSGVGVPPPRGVFCTGTTAGCCDPTGGGLNSEDKGTGTPLVPTSGLRAWMTHTEASVQSAPPFGLLKGNSVDEFPRAPLDPTELADLQAQCAILLGNSSGAGICNCGDPPVSTSAPPTPMPTPTATPTATATPTQTATATPTATPTCVPNGGPCLLENPGACCSLTCINASPTPFCGGG